MAHECVQPHRGHHPRWFPPGLPRGGAVPHAGRSQTIGEHTPNSFVPLYKLDGSPLLPPGSPAAQEAYIKALDEMGAAGGRPPLPPIRKPASEPEDGLAG
jgi:hypothetical protein